MLESHQNFVVFSIFWPQDCYPHDTDKNCKRWSIQITPQWHWASWKFEAWTKNHPVEDTLNRICGFLAEGSSQALEKCWPKLDNLNLDVYMPAGVYLCRIIYAGNCEHTAYVCMRQAKNVLSLVQDNYGWLTYPPQRTPARNKALLRAYYWNHWFPWIRPYC